MCSESIAVRAAAIADRAHQGQFRRDGATPYICHPRDVAGRVKGDDMAEAVAWLHDVLEDTDLKADDLRKAAIPQEVVDAVILLTRRDGLGYERYLSQIKANPLARKVKIADMLSNLNDHPTNRQIVKYAKGLLVLMS